MSTVSRTTPPGAGAADGRQRRSPGARRGRSPWGVVGRNAVSKILVMGVSGALAVVTTRLIIEHFGVAAYAQYGLLTSMASLVPFADLGMGAVIINAVAASRHPERDPTVRRTLVSAFRVLCVSAAVLIAVGGTLTLLGWWPAVLGEGLLPGGGGAALLCVVVFAATLPLGVGQRILTGLGRNHVQIGTQALAAPFVLGTVLVLVLTGARAGGYAAVLAYLANTVVAASALYLASRAVRPQIGVVLRAVPRPGAVPGVPVLDVAWPMLVQMLALPVAMQTDRLLLSHLSGSGELARYNLGSQLFGLITQTVSAAGLALWPVFARARSRSEIRSPHALAVGFCLGGLALAGVLAALMPWVAPIVSGGRIALDGWLVAGFVAFVGAQAAKYPLGMYMTDLRGLRFQVLPILVMVPINLGLSWILVDPLGAAGPVIGSAVAVTLCQVLPNVWYVRRDLARRRSEALGADDSVSAHVTRTTDAPGSGSEDSS